MTTEEKIKEIIKKAVEDTLILRSWNSDDDDCVKDIQKLITSEIQEEKTKMLEGLKYSIPFKSKDGEIYDPYKHGQDEGTKEFMSKIANLISELREEGRRYEDTLNKE